MPAKAVAAPVAPAAPAWTIRVDGHPLSPNGRAAASLRERMRDKRCYREAVAWECRRLYGGPPLQRAHVAITLYRRGGRPYDDDGAIGVCKYLIDGLCVPAGGTLLVDDGPGHVVLEVRQERGGWRGVELEISPVIGGHDTLCTNNIKEAAR